MNHKLLSSLTASLLIATVGLPNTTNAQNPEVSAQDSESNSQPSGLQVGASDSTEPTSSLPSPVARLGKQSNEVVKVGEQQSHTATRTSSEVVVNVQPHELSGREAATLYVRNIPILTFMGARVATPDGMKLGRQSSPSSEESSYTKSLLRSEASSSTVTSLLRSSFTLTRPGSTDYKYEALSDRQAEADPVWRASVVAARINQLQRDGIQADSITVSWDDQPKDSTNRDRLVIRANRIAIATLDSNTILPNGTRNLEQDALQATNRLRRLLGNAAPLREISGQPGSGNIAQNLATGAIRLLATGFASWYGPGFHGNQSASGERFNQYAMTAAHRTLPFGTRVLVTNLDNGQSVVVRINDRGPFHGNRVIDVSKGAASVLGLVHSGIARVRLDVIDPRSASVNN